MLGRQALPVIASTVFVALQMLTAPNAAAEPVVSISPKWEGLERHSKECDGFPEDKLILKIKDGKEEVTHEYCSSYGIQNAELIKDAQANYFIILRYAIGRGTHATAQDISIFKVYTKPLDYDEYVRIPVEAPSGPSLHWYYDYVVTKPKGGGIVLSLTFRLEGEKVEGMDIPYPREPRRTISIK